MIIARRLFGLLCGVSGGTGLLLCVAGIVGCWWLHAEVAGRVHRVFGRAETLLTDVGDSLGQVGGLMRQTQRELEAVRQREVDLAAKPPAERNTRRLLSRKTLESVTPQISQSRATLAKATEIALVANGLLEALAGLPLAERTGVDTDKLKNTSEELSTLIGRADKLAGLLANSAPDQPGQTVADESSRLEEFVGRIAAATDDGENRVNDARSKIADCHARLIWRITLIAVVLTAVLVWIAAGQFSLMLHGRALI